MRIAQIAPLAESVPPTLYGGTERVIGWLTDELIKLGHQVTLFASGDSRTRAELVPVWPRALRLSRTAVDPLVATTASIDALASRALDFDVIHCHVDWIFLPLLSRLGVPYVTTMHGRVDLPGLPEISRRFPEAPFVSISDSQRRPLPDLNWVSTVHHGLPPESLRPCYEAGSYLAFLGRLSPEKGPEAAIRIAKAAGMPLRIAAKVPRAARGYVRDKLEPLIDDEQIQFVGEVNESQKQSFLGGAAALLFPIDWPEPFGLVMIEAMACGTPVIAYRSGSVPEVVDHGITGFIADGQSEALAAIRRLDELDRRGVRAQFEKRFTSERMARGYLDCYQSLIARGHRPINEALLTSAGTVPAHQ